MAENNISFKTAFKKFLDSPSDTKEHKECNIHTGSTVPKRNSWNKERPSYDGDSEITAHEARAEVKVNDWFNRCQSNAGLNEYSGNKSRKNLNQSGKVPEWNEDSRKILGNESDSKEKGRYFQKEGSVVQKSVAPKKKERTTTKKENSHEYDSEKKSVDSTEGVPVIKKSIAHKKRAKKAAKKKANKYEYDYEDNPEVIERHEKLEQAQNEEIKRQMEEIRIDEEKKQIEHAKNMVPNEMETKETKNQNRNYFLQKSETTVKQIEDVDNSNYQNRPAEAVANYNYLNDEFFKRNYRNKPVDERLILTKPKTAEKQVEPVNNKKGKKKNHRNRKQVNEEELELYDIFKVCEHTYQNIHSSGDRYSANDEYHTGVVKKQPPRSAYWEHPIVHPIIEQPVQRIVDTKPWTPPPPIPFDEPAWDDDLLF